MSKLLKSTCATAILFLVANAATAAPTVYIPLGDANEILVVDAATDKAIRTIKDVINPHGLAMTPDGRYLVAGSNQEKQPGAAALPPKPAGMSEAEHRSHHSPPPKGARITAGVSHVDVIDAATGRSVRRVEVKGAVHHNLVTPDGRYAISTHTTAGGISVINLASFEVVNTVATGLLPNYLAITRDGKRLYVSNAGNNTVSEVDTADWIVTRNLRVGAGPEHLVLSEDEQTLYINNTADGTVSAVGLAQGKVLRTYKVGKSPHGIDLSADQSRLFATSKAENKVVAIDLATGTERVIPLSPAPYHLTAITGTGKLYVSSREEPKIWVLDANSLAQVGEIPIRGVGHQMVVADTPVATR